MLHIFRTTFTKLLQPSCRAASTKFDAAIGDEDNKRIFYDTECEPVISTRKYIDEHKFFTKPRQVWLENLDTVQEKKLGLVTLHPEIFGSQPRTDIIHENVIWQRLYRSVVSWKCSVLNNQGSIAYRFIASYVLFSHMPIKNTNQKSEVEVANRGPKKAWAELDTEA